MLSNVTKAFHTVPLEGLVDVLQQCGVRSTVLNGFANYLSNRRQSTEGWGSLSDPKLIKIGIPQGTVLGLILFIISYAEDTYCNDHGKHEVATSIKSNYLYTQNNNKN